MGTDQNQTKANEITPPKEEVAQGQKHQADKDKSAGKDMSNEGGGSEKKSRFPG